MLRVVRVLSTISPKRLELAELSDKVVVKAQETLPEWLPHRVSTEFIFSHRRDMAKDERVSDEELVFELGKDIDALIESAKVEHDLMPKYIKLGQDSSYDPSSP
jgi:hypothetical protein